MTCTVTIEFGEKKWEITSDKLSPDSRVLTPEIIEALKELPEILQQIKDAILQFKLDSKKSYRRLTPRLLLSKKGLMGNATVGWLSLVYPDITFPESSKNVEVLALDHLSLGLGLKYGITSYVDYNSDGQDVKELIIIPNTEHHMLNLANFLKARDTIKTISTFNDDTDPEYKVFSSILDIYNKAHAPKKGAKTDNRLQTVQLLALKFLTDPESFRTLGTYNNLLIYNILNNQIRSILELQQRTNYESPLLNAFNSLLDYFRLGKNNSLEPSISVRNFMEVLNAFAPKILTNLGLTTVGAFDSAVDLTLDKFPAEVVQQIFDLNLYKDGLNKVTLAEALVDYIGFEDLSYPRQFGSIKPAEQIRGIKYPKRIALKLKLNSMHDAGFTFQELLDFTLLVDEPGSYRIYEKVVNEAEGPRKEYYVTRYLLTDTSRFTHFDTLEEAQEFAKRKTMLESLSKAGMLLLHGILGVFNDYDPDSTSYKLNLFTQLLPESQIDVIDLEVSPDALKNLPGSLTERNLLYSRTATYSDFYNYISSGQFLNLLVLGQTLTPETLGAFIANDILKKIDTAEKAALFLQLLNEDEALKDVNDRVDLEAIGAIADKIDKAALKPHKVFYVAKQGSRSKNPVHGFAYGTTLYPSTEGDMPIGRNQLASYRANKRAPILRKLYGIQKAFALYGVNINIVTSENIVKGANALYKGINPNTDKAFIIDGNIYINLDIANPDDAFHEYTHILLGYLRSNPQHRKHYLQLLELLISTDAGKAKLDEMVLKRGDLASRIDLAEEVFADMFAAYMLKDFGKLGGANGLVVQLFLKDSAYDPNRFVDEKGHYTKKRSTIEAMASIFDLAADLTLPDVFGSTIQLIFSKFNHDVASLLATLGSDWSFRDKTQITASRKMLEFIEEQIKEGEIKEKCE